MPTTREEVLRSALELSESDRLLLATEIMDTLADDLPGLSVDDSDFEAELERRANDGSRGTSWDVVHAQLRADLNS